MAPLLTKPLERALLEAVNVPFLNFHQDFLNFKNDSIYRVSHDASVGKLQKVLNDHFDDVPRRIYIKNVQQRDSVRFYSAAAQREVGFYAVPKHGYRSSLDFIPGVADFRVFLPLDIQPNTADELQRLEQKIKAQLDYYKLYAKNYELIWTEL